MIRRKKETQPRTHRTGRATPLLLPSTMEYLSALNPSGLLRSVSNMSSEFGRKVWTSPPPPQRPFRVCDHKRTTRKGLTAATRQELLDKATEALLLSGMLTLVLEEDGTAVESEDFFQLLEDDTCLMVLECGQSWSPSRVRGPRWGCCGPPVLYIFFKLLGPNHDQRYQERRRVARDTS